MTWMPICTSLPLFSRSSFLVQRYILLEFFSPFLFSVVMMGCILTTGFVLFNLLEQSVQFQIPFTLALQIFLARIPEMLFYTLPMASLLGSMLAFSRLSGDGELLSLRMMGWSFYQLLMPLMLGGCLLALLAIILNETLLPASAYSARQLLHYAQTRQPEIPVLQSHLVFRQIESGQLKYLLYAKQADKKYLYDLVLQIFEPENSVSLLQSKRASLQDGQWTFYSGKIFKSSSDGRFQSVDFLKFQYPLQLSTQKIMQESRLPLEMSLSELHQYIQDLEASGQNVSALKVRWHQKIALPMTTLIFIILGAAMGARTLSSRLQGFGFSLLLIFVYYLFFALGTAMGDSGRVSAWFAAWMADGLTALSASFLAWKRNQWG